MRFYWKKGPCCWKKSEHHSKSRMCFQALDQSPDHSLPLHSCKWVAEKTMMFNNVVQKKICKTNAHSTPWEALRCQAPT